MEYLHLPKDHVVAFVEKDFMEGDVFEISTVEEKEDNQPGTGSQKGNRNSRQTLDLLLTHSLTDNFVKYPTEVPSHRKVLLNDRDISPQTEENFNDIISKNSGDIGKTMLVEIDIDTKNHPPVALNTTHYHSNTTLRYKEKYLKKQELLKEAFLHEHHQL